MLNRHFMTLLTTPKMTNIDHIERLYERMKPLDVSVSLKQLIISDPELVIRAYYRFKKDDIRTGLKNAFIDLLKATDSTQDIDTLSDLQKCQLLSLCMGIHPSQCLQEAVLDTQLLQYMANYMALYCII